MKNTIVFLGPTISLTEAQSIFPEGCYHFPARCGDVLRVLRLKPSQIVLIDGNFEYTRSIWHKEILYAIEKGVAVYGASSMGALRAAELTDFGMHGVGKIFQEYHRCILNEDDAVAVLHATDRQDFAPISEALVDINATLEKLRCDCIITEAQKNQIHNQIADWFYPDRSLENIKWKGHEESLFALFSNYVQKNGMIRQKANDAREALTLAKNGSKTKKNPFFEIPKTTFFRSLLREINISPFTNKYDWLPQEEKDLIDEAQIDNKLFNVHREFSFALMACYDLAKSNPHTPDPLSFDSLSDTTWNNTLKNIFPIFPKDGKLGTIYTWIFWQVKLLPSGNHELSKYVNCLSLLLGYNPNEIKEIKVTNVLFHFAFIFFGIDCFLDSHPYILAWHQNPYAQQIVGKFHNLDKIRQAVFQSEKSIDERNRLLTKIVRYYFVLKGATYNSVATIQELESNNWLLLAKQIIDNEICITSFFNQEHSFLR